MRNVISIAWSLCIAACVPVRFVARLFHASPEVVILLYHSISDDPRDPYAVSASEFEYQMRLVKRLARPITLSEAVSHAAGVHGLAASSVAVTFDDGYADVARTALPILRRLGIPCTVFVCEEPRRDELQNDHPLLGADDIADLSRDPLVEIGAHGATHRKLTDLSDEDALAEMTTSKHSVEALTGKPCRYFAYPKGASNPHVRALARRAGFEAACTVKQGTVRPGRDPMSMKRVIVQSGISRFQFRWRLTRIADWTAAVRKLLLSYG